MKNRFFKVVLVLILVLFGSVMIASCDKLLGWLEKAKEAFELAKFIPEISEVLPGFEEASLSSRHHAHVEESMDIVTDSEILRFEDMRNNLWNLNDSLASGYLNMKEKLDYQKELALNAFTNSNVTVMDVWTSDLKYHEDETGMFLLVKLGFYRIGLSIYADETTELFFGNTKDGIYEFTKLTSESFLYMSNFDSESYTGQLLWYFTHEGDIKKAVDFSLVVEGDVINYYLADISGDATNITCYGIYDTTKVGGYFDTIAYGMFGGVPIPVSNGKIDLRAFANIAEIYYVYNDDLYAHIVLGLKLTDGTILDFSSLLSETGRFSMSEVRVMEFIDNKYVMSHTGDFSIEFYVGDYINPVASYQDALNLLSLYSDLILVDGINEIYESLFTEKQVHFDSFYLLGIPELATIKVDKDHIVELYNAIIPLLMDHLEAFN